MASPEVEEKTESENFVEDFVEELEPTDLEVAVDEPERIVPAIEFRDIHLSFDGKKILDGVSFTVGAEKRK